MAPPHPPTDPGPDLDALALAFVVRVHGRWTERARAELAAQLRPALGVEIAPGDLDAALARARARYDAGPARLFACTGERCRPRLAAAARRSASLGGVALERTACLGPCERAPLVALRVGGRCQLFAGVRDGAAVEALAGFARRAAAADTLLVDPGTAQALRFDPVHAHESGAGALHAVDFLLGHFRGEGRLEPGARGDAWFQKELIGALEAGGRFVSLRMAVTYPLADGRKDVHEALIVIGAERDGALRARAYTDGGATREFALESAGAGIRFADAPPVHGPSAKRARKSLEPSAGGVTERLELDRGDGVFVPYSTLPMRRVAPDPMLAG